MKIQINSLQALERLIGGDNEMEFEIRRSIVDSFTKKHLKSLALEPAIQNISLVLKREIEDMLSEGLLSRFKPQGSYYESFKLSQKGVKLINQIVDIKINEQLNKLVSEKFEESAILKNLNIKIQSAANRISEQLTDKAIDNRISLLADKKIKQKLGIDS